MTDRAQDAIIADTASRLSTNPEAFFQAWKRLFKEARKKGGFQSDDHLIGAAMQISGLSRERLRALLRSGVPDPKVVAQPVRTATRIWHGLAPESTTEPSVTAQWLVEFALTAIGVGADPARWLDDLSLEVGERNAVLDCVRRECQRVAPRIQRIAQHSYLSAAALVGDGLDPDESHRLLIRHGDMNAKRAAVAPPTELTIIVGDEFYQTSNDRQQSELAWQWTFEVAERGALQHFVALPVQSAKSSLKKMSRQLEAFGLSRDLVRLSVGPSELREWMHPLDRVLVFDRSKAVRSEDRADGAQAPVTLATVSDLVECYEAIHIAAGKRSVKLRYYLVRPEFALGVYNAVRRAVPVLPPVERVVRQPRARDSRGDANEPRHDHGHPAPDLEPPRV